MEKKTIQAITERIEGKMIAIASDESEDRAGDIIKVDSWDFKNFLNNPVLQAGHDYRPQFTIGIAKNLRVEGKKVIFEPVFHTITKLAKEIKQMYEEGILKAWSVGYIPGDRNELLEISAVAVPANANALMLVKGMDLNEEKEVKEKTAEFVKKEVTKKKKDNGVSMEEFQKEVGEIRKELELDPELKEIDIKPIEKEEKSPMCRMNDESWIS